MSSRRWVVVIVITTATDTSYQKKHRSKLLNKNSIIDTSKARLSVRFPYLSDIRGKPYWMLFGCDQLLHQFVIVIIWFVSHQ